MFYSCVADVILLFIMSLFKNYKDKEKNKKKCNLKKFNAISQLKQKFNFSKYSNESIHFFFLFAISLTNFATYSDLDNLQDVN